MSMWEEAHASQSASHVEAWLSTSQPPPLEEGEPPAAQHGDRPTAADNASDAPLSLAPEQPESEPGFGCAFAHLLLTFCSYLLTFCSLSAQM